MVGGELPFKISLVFFLPYFNIPQMIKKGGLLGEAGVRLASTGTISETVIGLIVVRLASVYWPIYAY